MEESKSTTKPESTTPLISKSSHGRFRQNASKNGTTTNRNKTTFMPRPTKFKGKREKIKDDIFDTPDRRQKDLFNKTLKSIADYIQRTYPNGMECSTAVCNMTDAVFETPESPLPGADDVTKVIFTEEVKQYVKDKRAYKCSMVNIYAPLIGQCTDSIVAAVESHTKYPVFSKKCDALALLKAIKEISYASESHRYEPLQLYKNKRKFFTLYQKRHVSHMSSVF